MNNHSEEKIIEIPDAIIHSRSDGIVHVTFKEGVELDVDLQYRMMKIYFEVCANKKKPFMYSAFTGVTVTREAKLNAIKLEPDFPSLAVAVIADSLPYRLIADFYLKMNKPIIPYKVFKDIASAEVWLKEYL